MTMIICIPGDQKLLCATRWLCRLEAIQSALDQYPVVLQSLQEMASGVTDTATKANGLLDRFQKGKSLSWFDDGS